jgi:hypothetical protein
MTYILVACVCENNDWKRCKNLNRPLDVDDIDVATRGRGVADREVVDHKNDQITNGNERNNGSVLQAVEPAQKRKGYHNEPEMKSAVPFCLLFKVLT